MQYSQLASSYKYDLIAQNVYSREMEYFHYDFDKTNFEQMLATMPADAPNRADIEKRLSETITQMGIVKSIYDALLAQIDDQVAYEAAVQRAAAKRAQS